MTIDPRFNDLIAHLWRGGKYALLWTSDDGTGAKYSYWLTVGGALDVPKLFEGKDAYFAVNPSIIRRSEHERARIEDVQAVNGFFCEFDCPTPEAKEAAAAKIKAWKIPASCVIDSGGGYHCYAFLRATFAIGSQADRKRAADLQWAFVQYVGGEKGVSDLARVLRIPGTYNHKPRYGPDGAPVVIVDWQPQNQYDLAELEPLLQPFIDKRDAAKAHTPTPSVGTVSLGDQELLDVLFKSKNGDLYRRLWSGDDLGDHSVADQKLCNGLAWLTGRDIARMDSLFRQSGLYRDKWRDRDDYRENTLNNAADSAQTVYDPGYVDPQAVKFAQSAIGMGGSGTPPPPTSGTAQPTGSGSNQNIDQYLLDQGANDEGNAQCALALYGDLFAHCEAYGYLHYNGRYWQSEGAEGRLKTAIVATLQRRAMLALLNNKDPLLRAAKPNSNNVRNCLYLFRRLIDVDINDFDQDRELLNCNNGVVDLRTGAIDPHTPSQKFTYCVPVDYDPTADYVLWTEFLAKVTPQPEVSDYLRMAAGYSATGYTREECLFYIHGPTRSGKGTFAETLLAILPKPLGVEVDFSTFTAKREADTQNFDLAPLKPARFIIASESNKYDSLNEAKIKAATGGNWIRCAFKHRDHFEYRPQFKIWLTSNHPVKGDVDDDALWGRVKVVEFPNSFLGKEDKTLKQRMQEESNLKGVLRWIVEGAMAWFAAPQGLQTPQAVIDATAARRRDLDYIQQWLDQCCKIDASAWTPNSDIRTSYEAWCKQEGIVAKQAEQLSRSFTQKGFTVGVRKRTPLGKLERGVEGFSII